MPTAGRWRPTAFFARNCKAAKPPKRNTPSNRAPCSPPDRQVSICGNCAGSGPARDLTAHLEPGDRVRDVIANPLLTAVAPPSAPAVAPAAPPPAAPVNHEAPAEIPTQLGPKGLRFDFNDGCRVFLPESDHPWRVRLSDLDTGNVLYETTINAGRINSARRYYVRFRLEVWQQDELLLQHDYS